MTRKSPNQHRVRSHTRMGKTVKSYSRGRGNSRRRPSRYRVVIEPDTKGWLDKFLKGVSEYMKKDRITMKQWFKTEAEADESAHKFAIAGETWAIEKTNRRIAYPWETIRIDKKGKKYYSGGEWVKKK